MGTGTNLELLAGFAGKTLVCGGVGRNGDVDVKGAASECPRGLCDAVGREMPRAEAWSGRRRGAAG